VVQEWGAEITHQSHSGRRTRSLRSSQYVGRWFISACLRLPKGLFAISLSVNAQTTATAGNIVHTLEELRYPWEGTEVEGIGRAHRKRESIVVLRDTYPLGDGRFSKNRPRHGLPEDDRRDLAPSGFAGCYRTRRHILGEEPALNVACLHAPPVRS